VPLSAFEVEGPEPAIEPERFRGPDDPYPGHWRSYPTDWGTLPEQRLLSRETLDVVRQAIEELPEAQRTVITLRDVAGFTADEVCEALGVSDGNQRVLLHRARARVRARLERHIDG
jgi:RNA polymerase sigma-70 factor (ECF subfamily)